MTSAFDTEHIMRQLDPKAWAQAVLEATKTGWPLPTSTTEIALRLTGDIDHDTEAERIAADLNYNRLKHSGDLMRRQIHHAHAEEVHWNNCTQQS